MTNLFVTLKYGWKGYLVFGVVLFLAYVVAQALMDSKGWSISIFGG